jgi:flagellar basal body rod protein FlgC
MNSLTNIASSGLRLQQQALQVTAGNVARGAGAQTRQRLESASLPEGGVVATGVSEQPASLVADVVDGLQARAGFQANVSVLERGNQALGSLLDVLA